MRANRFDVQAFDEWCVVYCTVWLPCVQQQAVVSVATKDNLQNVFVQQKKEIK
ncbi:hypothetical protein HNQ91_000492 [Filimonas zeae]|nr:hypothetical protein [Filimonas zeae]MDR6337470.1 hypothetical protein [Filimonas zeae]